MSAPDLCVASTADLIAELERREQALRDLKCDACGGRLHRDPTCARPERHHPQRENAVRPTGRLVLTGPRGCGKTTVADLYRRLAHHNGLGRYVGQLRWTEDGWSAVSKDSGAGWSPPVPTATRALALLLAAPAGALAARAAEVDAWRAQDARIAAARERGQVEVIASGVAVLLGAGAIGCVQAFGWPVRGNDHSGASVVLLFLAAMFALCAFCARAWRRVFSRRPGS